MKTVSSFALILSLSFLIACSNQKPETSSEKHSQHTEATEEMSQHGTSDIREETAGVDTLPTFLMDKSKDIRVIYQAAAEHRDLLEKIPCYCGCGKEANHKNNYDCFVHENKENGAVVWDDHGTKCGVCLEIAAQSVMDFSNGKSVKEIREKIDKTYEKGYAKPTPTPNV
ncbi:PCYCGC motif-containing (lipo)protein [Fictibacillus sp. NRS-1165]|uniref:PCYCGC motif-containing (lipo)protein n=1 Tax=Fictibacillus sp. NRS-1165 TaxID=3144463 RepID=UPI003D1A96E7